MFQLRKLPTVFGVAAGTLLLLFTLLLSVTPASAQRTSTTATAVIASATMTATAPLSGTANTRTSDAATGITVAEGNGASSPLGYLTFSDGAVAGGNYQLQMMGLPPTPATGHYVLWLSSPVTESMAIGSFTVTDAATTVVLTGTTAYNLPLFFNKAQITLEPLSVSSITTTLPTGISARVVITAQPVITTVNLLRPLLQLYADEEAGAAAITDTASVNGPVRALAAAQAQVDIAVQHTGFLRSALSTDDIPQARRHAEHIINILDGQNGFMYGDLDRNGIPENPGDSVGVRLYLAAVKEALPALEMLPRSTGTAAATETIATETIATETIATVTAAIDRGQTRITDLFDKALQIFASDTVTEANRFAGELTTLVDELDATVGESHNQLLQLLSFPFYGPPQAVTLPATAITTTNRISSTDVATTTLGIRLQPTATTTRTADSGAGRVTGTPALVPTPTATPIPPLPTVESIALVDPAAGSVWRHPLDGVNYVYVPGGDFVMGATGADAVSPKEEPQHTVTVDAFWLQQTETTNAQYARCVADGECTPPANERWDAPTFAEHPVSNVTWAQAAAYAAWAGGRLPTEAEWERTCRADDARTYPWGDEDATTALANFNNAIGDTVPVGSYPEGQGAYGALDLSGNLWEWTSSVEDDYPYDAADGRENEDSAAGNRTVRGGSYYYTNYQIRCAARTGFSPNTANEHIGFRIVLTEPTVIVRNPVDGAVYIYVPGGAFVMGATGADAVSPKEEPQHTVTVDAFWLQQTETTNAQYARCVADGECTPPANERWDAPTFAEHPVSNVTWAQAAAYAAWAGGRLPTEAEWERTCRADNARTYPWGDEDATTDLANFNNAIGDTVPVGSYPEGQSAYGALDLSGNLWEWTSSVEDDYPYDAADGRENDDLAAGNRTVRGGSYYYTNYQIRCAARTGFPSDTANEHIGFRVVWGTGDK